MKKLLITLFTALLTLHTLSQSLSSIQIKGSIHDKETNLGLEDATVTCMQSKDSSRIAQRFTDKKGNFELTGLPAQDFLLYITYVGYQPLIYNVKTTINNQIIDLGILKLKKTGVTLAEVEIRQIKPPVKIMKDTIEFNASQFKTRENSIVEDLLKKIPGIQIDPDGTIRMNGEIIKSIMVNGRLLFGSGDPKIIAKNLQADLIDRIQVFNKNKEEGISSGGTDKIINITIKKNKQNKISGELESGIGSASRFSEKMNLSRFRDHQQILLIATGNNTNGTPTLTYTSGSGLNRIWNIGGSYLEDLSKKITVSGSYTMTDNLTEQNQANLRQNFINDAILINKQDSKNSNHNTLHGISLQLEYKPDSVQKITFSSGNVFSNTKNLNSNTSESILNNKNLSNSTLNNSTGDNTKVLSGSLAYDRKFRKQGRLLHLDISYTDGKDKGSQLNKSQNQYFQNNGETTKDTINQHIDINNLNTRTFLTINYTEPITKDGALTFTFCNEQMNISYTKSTLNFNSTTGLYDKYIDTLSNRFKYTSLQHSERITWSQQKSQFNYSISILSLFYNLQSNIQNSANNISQRSMSLIPYINLNYTTSNNKQLRLSYLKELQLPDINQLQPTPDISNPLYIKLGNTDLKPADAHNIQISYNSFNTNSLRTFSIYLNGIFNNNQITNDTKIDSVGRQTSQFSNHSGAYSIDLGINGGFPIKKRANALSSNTQFIIQKGLSYLNGEKNTNNKTTITQALSYSSDITKMLDYTLSGNLNYNKIRYYNISSTNISYFSFGISSSANLTLPAGITLSSFMSYAYTSGLAAGYNTSIWILNAQVSKTLFRHKEGLITFQGLDLLKQNKNIIRNVQVDYIEDTRINTLPVFFLLKISYFPAKK